MMQKKPYNFTCSGICWVVGAAFGLLLALVLGLGMVLGFFCSVVVGVGASLFFQWAFCNEKTVSQVLGSDSVHTPAGRPVAQSTVFDADAAKSDAVTSPAVFAQPPLAEVAAIAKVQHAKPAAKAKPVAKTTAPKGKAKKTMAQAKLSAPSKASAGSNMVEIAVVADGKPEMLAVARGGKADNLKEIKGVGPKLESLLNRMGVFHFDQIAAWQRAEVAWMDENLEGFKGRVSRDTWVNQAKILAAGNDAAFSKRVGKGEVY